MGTKNRDMEGTRGTGDGTDAEQGAMLTDGGQGGRRWEGTGMGDGGKDRGKERRRTEEEELRRSSARYVRFC